MRRIITATASAALAVALGAACASNGRQEWVRADGTPESPEVSELRAKDRAACVSQMGAPTAGVQSAMSYSRTEVENCMRARGWRKSTDQTSR